MSLGVLLAKKRCCCGGVTVPLPECCPVLLLPMRNDAFPTSAAVGAACTLTFGFTFEDTVTSNIDGSLIRRTTASGGASALFPLGQTQDAPGPVYRDGVVSACAAVCNLFAEYERTIERPSSTVPLVTETDTADFGFILGQTPLDLVVRHERRVESQGYFGIEQTGQTRAWRDVPRNPDPGEVSYEAAYGFGGVQLSQTTERVEVFSNTTEVQTSSTTAAVSFAAPLAACPRPNP